MIKRKFKVPYPLEGNIFHFGSVGSGKSCKNLQIAQQYYERGYKIWDLYGYSETGGRNEGAYWTLPNDDKALWAVCEAETYEFKNPGPKEYKVNLLYPMFHTQLPKKLPQTKDGRVKSIPFTIPIKDITIQDIKMVIGEITNNQIITDWELLQESFDNKTTIEDVNYLIEEISEKDKEGTYKMKKTYLYKMFLRPLIKEKLLMNKNFDLNIDLVTEATNHKTISVLCLDHVPARFRYFIMEYLIRKVFDGLASHKIKRKKNLGIFREAADFLKVEESTEDKNSPIPLFKNFIRKCARMCRDGFFLMMDTQSSRETRGLVSGSENLTVISRMTSIPDFKATIDPFKENGLITKAKAEKIPVLKKEEFCTFESGKPAVIYRRMFPPRTMYFKQGKPGFYAIWADKVGEYKDIGDDLDLVEEKCKESKMRWLIKKQEIERNESLQKQRDKPKEEEKVLNSQEQVLFDEEYEKAKKESDELLKRLHDAETNKQIPQVS